MLMARVFLFACISFFVGCKNFAYSVDEHGIVVIDHHDVRSIDDAGKYSVKLKIVRHPIGVEPGFGVVVCFPRDNDYRDRAKFSVQIGRQANHPYMQAQLGASVDGGYDKIYMGADEKYLDDLMFLSVYPARGGRVGRSYAVFLSDMKGDLLRAAGPYSEEDFKEACSR